MSKNVNNLLKVGVPLVLAVFAYLLQVDPLALCKGTLPPVVEQPSTADAGQN